MFDVEVNARVVTLKESRAASWGVYMSRRIKMPSPVLGMTIDFGDGLMVDEMEVKELCWNGVVDEENEGEYTVFLTEIVCPDGEKERDATVVDMAAAGWTSRD